MSCLFSRESYVDRHHRRDRGWEYPGDDGDAPGLGLDEAHPLGHLPRTVVARTPAANTFFLNLKSFYCV